jgi:hypothetical protein
MNTLDPHLFFGLDLGRRQDPSALAAVERLHMGTGRVNRVTYEPETRLSLIVRHLELFRLGTPYLDVVRRMARLLNEPQTLDGYQVEPGHPARPHQTLVVDATGVGAPVVEALQVMDLEAGLTAITITGAGQPHADAFGGTLVARRDLLSNLRLVMERGLLRVPEGLHERDGLTEEWLRAADPAGPAHDDRVVALALAVWQATRGLARLMEALGDRGDG